MSYKRAKAGKPAAAASAKGRKPVATSVPGLKPAPPPVKMPTPKTPPAPANVPAPLRGGPPAPPKPLPEVQIPAITEIGVTGVTGVTEVNGVTGVKKHAALYTSDDSPLVQILVVEEPGRGPAGWTLWRWAITEKEPFVLTPEMIVAVGDGAYCRINAGWGDDPRRAPLAFVEGVAVPARQKPAWIPEDVWDNRPPEVVRVVHSLAPPVLHTRKHVISGGAVVEELFTTSAAVQILR